MPRRRRLVRAAASSASPAASAQRYESFRRFVLGFYTPEFRDLFFAKDPPSRVFRSVVTIFAGYWQPSLRTRAWVALFFLLVKLQRRLKLVPPHVANAALEESGPAIQQ